MLTYTAILLLSLETLIEKLGVITKIYVYWSRLKMSLYVYHQTNLKETDRN